MLVPYVTGGFDPSWLEVVRAVAAAGADAVEVGLPFSDPVMDGPVIQEASVRALAAGTTPEGVVSALAGADIEIPMAVMTYANPVVRLGYRRFASRLADAGVAAAIIPDLPIEEQDEWAEEAAAAGVERVQLVAPTTTAARLARLCGASQGFVYAIGVLGVTGERAELAESALAIAARAKAVTDLPVLVGLGISSAEQAAAAASVADGVIVGSALMRRMLDGGGPAAAAEFVSSLRAGLDA